MEDIASRQMRLERRSAVVTSLAERVMPKSKSKGGVTLAAGTVPVSDARAKQALPRPATPNPLLTGAFAQSASKGRPRVCRKASRPSRQWKWHHTKLCPRTRRWLSRVRTASICVIPKIQALPFRLFPTRPAIRAILAMAPIPDADERRARPHRTGSEPDRHALAEALDRRDGTGPNRARGSRSLRRSPGSAEVLPVEDRKTRETGRNAAAAKEAVGGPFIPLKLDADGSAFERAAVTLQEAILAVEHLRRTISSVPLRKPVVGDPEVTSGFGVGVDLCFLRTPAMHTDIDLREDYGTDVHATASGKVTSAGPDGGYAIWSRSIMETALDPLYAFGFDHRERRPNGPGWPGRRSYRHDRPHDGAASAL